MLGVYDNNEGAFHHLQIRRNSQEHRKPMFTDILNNVAHIIGLILNIFAEHTQQTSVFCVLSFI